ncbi:hypothetical protein BD410DRAFT_831876 [Rickenella mellea]|uniref:F-box domain-containing protein n=1 Tax=Rickenella mellea TaxID=50990 RepID=A0A4Y7PNG0_9AGAM|nr:hypothetical protein BD410DRAFT_831876 [Rickenella mellea]
MSTLLDNLPKQIFDRPSISDILLDHCTPATIFRLGRTCKRLRQVTQFYCRRAFDINSHLRRFLSDPVGFRALMERTGTLISGSNALQLMDRTLYPESDLDIYAEQRHCREVGRWLVEREGYTFRPHLGQPRDLERAAGMRRAISDPEYEVISVYTVLDFISAPLLDGSQRIVQVIVARRSAMESAVMNVITHCAAYSLYPKATFEERRSLVIGDRLNLHRKALEKYASRGYRNVMQLMPDEVASPTSPFRTGERWVGDDVTWVIPLDMTGVKLCPLSRTTPALTFDPITLCSWKHYKRESKGTEDVTVKYCITHGELNSALFYYTYTVPPDLDDKYKNKDIWSWSDDELPAWKKILFEKRQEPGWNQPDPDQLLREQREWDMMAELLAG